MAAACVCAIQTHIYDDIFCVIHSKWDGIRIPNVTDKLSQEWRITESEINSSRVLRQGGDKKMLKRWKKTRQKNREEEADDTNERWRGRVSLYERGLKSGGVKCDIHDIHHSLRSKQTQPNQFDWLTAPGCWQWYIKPVQQSRYKQICMRWWIIFLPINESVNQKIRWAVEQLVSHPVILWTND